MEIDKLVTRDHLTPDFNFRTDYQSWDKNPYEEITRNNLMSFVVWSFWDSQGDSFHQYYRLMQLNQVKFMQQLVEYGFSNIFSQEELIFAYKEFYRFRLISKNRTAYLRHTNMLSVEEVAPRLERSLSFALKKDSQQLTKSVIDLLIVDMRQLKSIYPSST